MSYYNPEKFNCKHLNLIKSKFSGENLYQCENCNQQFRVIPSKNSPIYPEPMLPQRPRHPNKLPDLINSKRFGYKFN